MHQAMMGTSKKYRCPDKQKRTWPGLCLGSTGNPRCPPLPPSNLNLGLKAHLTATPSLVPLSPHPGRGLVMLLPQRVSISAKPPSLRVPAGMSVRLHVLEFPPLLSICALLCFRVCVWACAMCMAFCWPALSGPNRASYPCSPHPLFPTHTRTHPLALIHPIA